MPTVELRIQPSNFSKRLPNPKVNFGPVIVKILKNILLLRSSPWFRFRQHSMPTISRRYQVHALQSSSSSYSVIGFLAESDFLEDLGHIIKCFDKTTKLRFRNADEPQFVKFGSTIMMKIVTFVMAN